MIQLRASVVLLGALALATACKPKGLLRATVTYAQTSARALDQVAIAPGIVTGICYRRAQLNYLADQLDAPEQPVDSSEWKAPCKVYALAERTFDSALHAIAAYASALEAVARDDDPSLRGDLESATKSLTTGIAALSGSPLLRDHKDALAAVGTPIGFIADAVRTRWKSKQLGSLVRATHPQLATAIEKLQQYLRVVRESQLDATWQAYEMARATIDPKLVAVYDVLLRAELDRAAQRLDSLSRILIDIRDSHAALATGWEHGESGAASARKQIVQLGVLLDEELRAFERMGYQ